MTSIVPLSWDFRSLLCGVITHIAFFALVLNKTYRKPFTGLQLSTRDCCVIWQLGLVTIIIIHVELGVHLTHYTRGLSFRGLSFRGSEFSRSEFSRTRNFRPLQKSDELR